MKHFEIEGWQVVQAMGRTGVVQRANRRIERLIGYAIFAACGLSVWVTGGLHVVVHFVCAVVGWKCPL